MEKLLKYLSLHDGRITHVLNGGMMGGLAGTIYVILSILGPLMWNDVFLGSIHPFVFIEALTKSLAIILFFTVTVACWLLLLVVIMFEQSVLEEK
jgi:hypothetical protein